MFTKAFVSRSIEMLPPNISGVVDMLLDDLSERQKSGETVDWISDFAYPLPATVIMDLLGAPARRPQTRQDMVRRDRAVHRHRPRIFPQIWPGRTRGPGDGALFS